MSGKIDRTRTRRILLNVSVIVVSVFIVVAGFELLLVTGAFNEYYRTTKPCDGPEHWSQFHPIFGKTKPPNSQYLKQWRGTTEWTKHTHNAAGFRDVYNSGTENVVLLGDSYMAGYLADDNATYAYLLDRWLPDRAVRNFGIGGYGTAEELAVYRNKSTTIDHDLVILGYFPTNDMQDNSDRSPRRPQFTVVNGRLVQTSQPRNVQRSSDDPRLPFVHDFLLENTRSYAVIGNQLLLLQQLIAQRLGITAPPRPPSGADRRRELRLTRHLVSAIATEARKNDAELLIVFIPASGDVNPANPDAYRPTEGRQYWNVQRDMLQSIAGNHSYVHYLDLKPALQRVSKNGTAVYGQGLNKHLNERGYRVSAKATYRWLNANGYVAPGHDPDLTKRYPQHTGTACP